VIKFFIVLLIILLAFVFIVPLTRVAKSGMNPIGCAIIGILIPLMAALFVLALMKTNRTPLPDGCSLNPLGQMKCQNRKPASPVNNRH